MKKWWIVVLAVIPMSTLAFLVGKFVIWSNAFEKLQLGMTQSEVVSLFGCAGVSREPTPNRLPSWDQRQLDKDKYGTVFTEWAYASPNFIVPEAWVVGFDQKGRVVKRVHIFSP